MHRYVTGPDRSTLYTGGTAKPSFRGPSLEVDVPIPTIAGIDDWTFLYGKWRVQWTRTDTPSPRWEQAFSEDGGASWETNWEMDFAREASLS